MPPLPAIPRHRAAVGALALLRLGGAAQAQGAPPASLPLGPTIATLTGSSVVLFSVAAAFPPALHQTGRCRPLAGGAALSASNPPLVTGVVPGAPYTCELEFSPPAAPGAAIGGYVAICIGASPPLPTRYLIALGAGSPITVGGLTPGSAYQCSVQPYNGTGIAPGPQFTTLAAPPPAAQPIPTLGEWGLLMSLLAGLLGWRQLKGKSAPSA